MTGCTNTEEAAQHLHRQERKAPRERHDNIQTERLSGFTCQSLSSLGCRSGPLYTRYSQARQGSLLAVCVVKMCACVRHVSHVCAAVTAQRPTPTSIHS